jgi:hypothetical protein
MYQPKVSPLSTETVATSFLSLATRVDSTPNTPAYVQNASRDGERGIARASAEGRGCVQALRELAADNQPQASIRYVLSRTAYQ